MAWAFESSDRAQAHIFAALNHIASLGYGDEILRPLEDIKKIFEDYLCVFDDEKMRIKRMPKIKKLIAHLNP